MISTTSVDAYINSFPREVKERLQAIRSVVREEAPFAEEQIAYQMPAYKLNGKPLIYFAGFKKHIGLYATPSGHEAFKSELAPYEQGKGSVQFPLDQSLPIDLIRKIVAFRTKQNQERQKL